MMREGDHFRRDPGGQHPAADEPEGHRCVRRGSCSWTASGSWMAFGDYAPVLRPPPQDHGGAGRSPAASGHDTLQPTRHAWRPSGTTSTPSPTPRTAARASWCGNCVEVVRRDGASRHPGAQARACEAVWSNRGSGALGSCWAGSMTGRGRSTSPPPGKHLGQCLGFLDAQAIRPAIERFCGGPGGPLSRGPGAQGSTTTALRTGPRSPSGRMAEMVKEADPGGLQQRRAAPRFPLADAARVPAALFDERGDRLVRSAGAIGMSTGQHHRTPRWAPATCCSTRCGSTPGRSCSSSRLTSSEDASQAAAEGAAA